MSQRPGHYAGTNNGQDPQPQQRQQRPGFTSKQMLDAYIYDFLLKSSLKNSASTFCREAGILDAVEDSHRPSILDQVKDAPQGFLYEWWQIFWDLFNARTHKEGSAIAREFSRILENKQNKEDAYRSQAAHAARLQQMVGQNLEHSKSPTDFFQGPSFNSNLDHVGNAFNSNTNSYPRSRPSNIPNQPQVSSHTAQFVPPYAGANIPGWPVHFNQATLHFPNGTTGNHVPNHAYGANHINQYPTNGPVPSSSPQSVITRNKQSRTPSVKKKKHALNLADTPGSPGHSTVSYKGPVSGGFSGKITGIEGLHNYQRQLIMSEIEYNNQNKKHSPSSGANLGEGSKKHMLPPSAAISPHTVSPASASTSNLTMIGSSKPKITRRKSANHILGPVSKSMQGSLSDSPHTPSALGAPANGGEFSDKSIVSNSLTSVSEVGKSTSNSQDSSGKKGVRKVRKPKKPQSITFNNNSFNFISSNSVPTPPNETQQRSQYRTVTKSQKKSNTIRTNAKIIKSTSEASPQILGDDGSITTPTFITTVWNGRVQTTPHNNLTFNEDNSAQSTSTGFTNVDSVAGSSSGASYQYSETEVDDPLSINAILPINESPAGKDEVPPNSGMTGTSNDTTAHDGNNQEFHLDLLEPSEHSFNFLSWRQ